MAVLSGTPIWLNMHNRLYYPMHISMLSKFGTVTCMMISPGNCLM